MRRFPSTRVLLVLCALTLPVVTVAFTRPGAQEPQQTAKADESAPTVKKEDLRYDGKPFSYWRNFGRTEAKSERRIEFLRAMAAFGTAGYGEEAATAILELIQEYRESDMPERAAPGVIVKLSPYQQVVSEAEAAIVRIGQPAVSKLLASLKPGIERAFAWDLLVELFQSPKAFIAPADAPRLLDLVEGTDPELRSGALTILGINMKNNPAKEVICKTVCQRLTSLGEMLNGPQGEKLDKSRRDTAVEILSWLGPHAKEALPSLIQTFRKADPENRKKIAQAFQQMGPEAKDALPVLTQALQGTPPELSQAINAAIRQIRGEKQEKQMESGYLNGSLVPR